VLASFEIPRGTRPQWIPGAGHPIRDEMWWRWD
jgi:hypothetical protein